MTIEKKDLRLLYKPKTDHLRFWLHSEACYTEEELKQRAWILKTRAQSGINPQYLINPSSWFTEDNQALVNAYEHTWFYSNAYKPRHTLALDDFYVQTIDTQNLQWPTLYELMQKTGDYLLLRNKKMRTDHLNQPMNFFFLDINNILRGISQNNNIKQTQEQLTLLTRYVRTIEKNVSPRVDSDRLFLATFREFIDRKVHPTITHLLESQLLKDRLAELAKTLKQVSSDRNRILHFALNINPVNPHPYQFVIDNPDYLSAYPTQAALECGKSTEVMALHTLGVRVTTQQLQQCSNFQLISMNEEILDHYARAVSDLEELEQFQKVITQTIELLGQAGEVYTVYQFKEQLSLMLQQIDLFIDSSSQHIEEIIHANTKAYQKAIRDEQDLSFMKKWLTYEKEKLNTFIHNQDTLAQFPSTISDLLKTRQTLKEQVHHLISHLNKPKALVTNFAAIAYQAQELNTLLNSMHKWIKVQHQIKGLEEPNAPEQLEFLPQSQLGLQPDDTPLVWGGTEVMATNLYIPPQNQFPPKPLSITYYPDYSLQSQQSMPINLNFYLSVIALIPMGFLIFYLLKQLQKKERTGHCSELSPQLEGTRGRDLTP